MSNTHSDNRGTNHIPPLDIIDLDEKDAINAEGKISFDKSIALINDKLSTKCFLITSS